MGPIRAPTNVRASCRIDYNPSLCKDWHETGYCGFGDSCIYIHDRTDYKSGWELEKEWEREQAEKAKKYSISTKGPVVDDQSEDEDDSNGLPKACQICEQDFKFPVVTKCRHFFCEKCIFASYKVNKKCPVCESILNGIFNQAKELTSKRKTREHAIKKGRVVSLKEGRTSAGADSKEEKEIINTVHDFLKDVVFEETKDTENEKMMEKLANEFKSSVQEQKSKIQSETDWMY